MVLLKLFTPPLIIAELPASFALLAVPDRDRNAKGATGAAITRERDATDCRCQEKSPRGAIAAEGRPGVLPNRPAETIGHGPWSLLTVVGVVWCCGSFYTAAGYAVRIRRFAGLIRECEAAPPDIRAMTAQFSSRLGLRRRPTSG